MFKKKNIFYIVSFMLLGFILVGCGTDNGAQDDDSVTNSSEDPIIIGSFIDTEGGILGNMLLLALEDEGYTMTDKVQFGTPDVQRKALLENELHIGIDYTGNGQFYSEGIEEEVWRDRDEGYEAIKEYDKEENGLVWMQPAEANNTEMLAVKEAFADENDLDTLEDFARYVNDGGEVKFITSQLFAEKEMGLLGMEEGYGFDLSSDQLIMLPHGNTAETISALENDTDGVNVALVYGTDGSLPDLNLKVLKDPLSIPPVFEPSAIVQAEILEAYPEIEQIIDEVFATLDLETLQVMNKKVIVDGQSAKDVAQEHLEEVGILE